MKCKILTCEVSSNNSCQINCVIRSSLSERRKLHKKKNIQVSTNTSTFFFQYLSKWTSHHTPLFIPTFSSSSPAVVPCSASSHHTAILISVSLLIHILSQDDLAPQRVTVYFLWESLAYFVPLHLRDGLPTNLDTGRCVWRAQLIGLRVKMRLWWNYKYSYLVQSDIDTFCYYVTSKKRRNFKAGEYTIQWAFAGGSPVQLKGFSQPGDYSLWNKPLSWE